MVCSHSLAGVAPGEAPKAEATELAPEAVGASPPVATRYPGLTGPARLEGFPVGTRSASGETSEQRLWLSNAKIAGLARRTKWSL